MFGQELQVELPEAKQCTRYWPWLVAIVWIATVLAGLVVLWKYANTPARATEARTQWPANEQISLDPKVPTLVMFAHPHCPCTRASVAELARIAAQCTGQFAGLVVFFKPAESEPGWEQSDLKHSAEEIPGVRVVVDRDGKLARMFDVTTSGHALVYDPQGTLLFSGGITAARGHAGDNAGESAIVSLLDGLPADHSRTPVFGCPIHEDSASP